MKSAVGSLVERLTKMPPVGAAAFSMTVPVAPQPPLIVVGFIVIEVSQVVDWKFTLTASGPTLTENGPLNEKPASFALTEYVPGVSPSMKNVPPGWVGIMTGPAVIQEPET